MIRLGWLNHVGVASYSWEQVDGKILKKIKTKISGCTRHVSCCRYLKHTPKILSQRQLSTFSNLHTHIQQSPKTGSMMAM